MFESKTFVNVWVKCQYFCVFTLLMLFCTSMKAQNNTGTISGIVTDPAGSVVPGAAVTIVDLTHGTTVRSLTTNSAGSYTVPDLTTATYRVEVVAAGFDKQVIDMVVLHVHDQLAVNVSLKVGNVSDTVEVQANATEVETNSSEQSTLINGTQILQLPLSTRDYTNLTGLQPGVASVAGTAGGVSISINGLRDSANNWTVDGADNVDRGSNGTLLVQPSIDSIAEYKTLRDTYSAEFGRSASGQIDVVTKSGSKDFHGSAYEFFRNDILDANNYFSNLVGIDRPPLRYNDFGFTVGGPAFIPHVYNRNRDKTFFFYSQEFHRIVNSTAVSVTGDPSAQELAGNFENAVCTAYAADGSCGTASTAVTSTSTTAQAYIKDIFAKTPRPNNPSDVNGLVYNAAQSTSSDQEIVRIDHSFTPALTAFFKFENDSQNLLDPEGFSGSTYGLPGVNQTRDQYPGRQIVTRATWLKSPTTIFDIGYAYSYGGIHATPAGLMASSASPDIDPALPYTSTLPRVPELDFQGGTNLYTFGPYNDYNYSHNATLNVSKLLGSHTIRAGITYFHYEKNENLASYNAGVYYLYDYGTPAGSSATAFQQTFASFMQNSAYEFVQAKTDKVADVITNQAEGYIQDDWKATKRLTINAGLRYSWYQQPIDGKHGLTNFYGPSYNSANAPTLSSDGSMCLAASCANGTPNANYSTTNGIIIGGQNSPWGSRVAPQAWYDFAPRFGFAYDLTGAGKTVLRGGYGLAFDSSLFGIYEINIFVNPPFANYFVSILGSVDNPAGSNAYISTTPPTVDGTATQSSTPYAQQFSLGIQHELAKDLIVQVGYVGTLGVHLLGSIDINQPRPGAYITAGIAAADGITSSNTEALNLVRPYKGYGAINMIEPWFNSNYHSLQSRLQKRFADGSLIDLNYTFSHNLTNNQADRYSGIQNTYDMAAEYGRAAFDERQIFSADFVYTLPIFRGRQGLVGATLGNWQLGGLVFANSGLPATAHYYFSDSTLASPDPAGLGLLNSSSTAQADMRPDQLSDPNKSAKHSRTNWFDKAAFANIPAGQIRPGDAPMNSINGPRFQRWDLALYKTIPITKGVNLMLRGETVNTFNHTNFTTIDTSALSSSFGQATAAGDGRVIQVAAKLHF